MTDLGKSCRIEALQLNFADVHSTAYGRLVNDTYQYTLEISDDAKTWRMLLDRRAGGRDAPHEYVQLDQPVTARYAKLTNIHMPAGALFSISGLRLFGSGLGAAPAEVTGTSARRETNQRLMDVSWQAWPRFLHRPLRPQVRPPHAQLPGVQRDQRRDPRPADGPRLLLHRRCRQRLRGHEGQPGQIGSLGSAVRAPRSRATEDPRGPTCAAPQHVDDRDPTMGVGRK